MTDPLIHDPELESRVRSLASELWHNHNICRCYELSRAFAQQMPQYGFARPQVRDGWAAYSIDFLMRCSENFYDNEYVQRELAEKSSHFEYLFMDHSWCELDEQQTRIDYLPKIGSERMRFDFALLTDMSKETDEVEYWPIGQEFKLMNSTFLYLPLAGPKIGPLQLPRLIRVNPVEDVESYNGN